LPFEVPTPEEFRMPGLKTLIRFMGPIVLLLLLVPRVHAQTTLDDGTFRILVKGREVGRETFSIRQNTTGADAVVIAQGHAVLDRQQITASLEMGGAPLRPETYQVQVTGDGAQRIAARLAGNRFSAQISSPGGEAMHEYLASSGALVIDDGLAYQYYFLAQQVGATTRTVPLLVPRENRQILVQVTQAGTGPLDLDGTTVQARHLVVTPKGGDQRDVWADSDGHILKVAIPAQGYVAIRTAPHG
jgi:hypothetical protein